MGITFQTARMMWDARKHGARFDKTLTVGRQNLLLYRSEVKFFTKALQAASPTRHALQDYKSHDYVDGFLHDFLGATTVTAIDYSAYEGAQIIHNLSEPVSPTLYNQFDAVIDGGTLEHVFNFPVAISSLMRMLKPGGNIFISTPANNLLGHGFYQFSPELMFRIFTTENGFEMRRVLLVPASYPSVELTRTTRIYEVADPAAVGSRVGLVTCRPVMMAVHATKVADVVPFPRAPLQSDYVPMWESRSPSDARSKSEPSLLKRFYRALPTSLKAHILGYFQLREFSLSNSRFYKRL